MATTNNFYTEEIMDIDVALAEMEAVESSKRGWGTAVFSDEMYNAISQIIEEIQEEGIPVLLDDETYHEVHHRLAQRNIIVAFGSKKEKEVFDIIADFV